MKSSKIMLGLSAFAVVAAVSAAVVLNGGNKSYDLPVRALEKSFVFDGSDDVVNQFTSRDTSQYMSVSVETGISSRIETQISFTEDGSEQTKYFGTNGHFFEVGGTINPSIIDILIGVNNLKDFEIDFGATGTDGEALLYQIDFYDDNIDDVDYIMNLDGIDVDKDISEEWHRSDGNPVTTIEINFEADSFTTFYIDSISLTWTC